MGIVVGFKVAGNAACSAACGGDAAGVRVVNQGHFLVLTVFSKVTDDAANSVGAPHITGVSATGERGRVVLDPADDAADVGRACRHVAGVRAVRCADCGKRASAQTADTDVERADGRAVGAVGHGQQVAAAVCADLADQRTDIVIAVNRTAVDVHVFKSDAPGFMIADQHGKAVLLVAVAHVVNKDICKNQVSESHVFSRTEHCNAMIR